MILHDFANKMHPSLTPIQIKYCYDVAVSPDKFHIKNWSCFSGQNCINFTLEIDSNCQFH